MEYQISELQFDQEMQAIIALQAQPTFSSVFYHPHLAAFLFQFLSTTEIVGVVSRLSKSFNQTFVKLRTHRSLWIEKFLEEFESRESLDRLRKSLKVADSDAQKMATQNHFCKFVRQFGDLNLEVGNDAIEIDDKPFWLLRCCFQQEREMRFEISKMLKNSQNINTLVRN